MVNFGVLGINIFGTLVSIFSLSVTVNIYQKYKLTPSLLFVLSSSAIFVWNILHLIFNLLPNDVAFGLVRFLWIILVYSGIIFVFAFIFGYSNIRYDYLNWRLIVYTAFASIYAVIFLVKTDWINVVYNETEGWITSVENPLFWSLFSISILIFNFIEIIIPLINTYATTSSSNRNPLLFMLVGIILALFSNALEPVLTQSGLPQAIRFLVADVGFLIFFYILLKYPFTGLYDNSKIDRVIVANNDGTPLLTLGNQGTLTSGAIIGVNAVLEEIIAQDFNATKGYEAIRKLELGTHFFYIIIRGDKVIIFQFQNPTGVCYSKFKSLSRVFSGDIAKENLDKKLEIFEKRLNEYFETGLDNILITEIQKKTNQDE